MKIRSLIPVAISLTFFAGTATAYVGPGAGITVIGALWGLIAGVVMAVGVILFWPIRMLLRKRKANQEALAAGSAEGTAEGSDNENDATAENNQAKSESTQSS
jgi:hypothetical protein